MAPRVPIGDLPPEPEGDNELPVICVTHQRLRDLTAQALDALVGANEPPVLYVRHGELVRVVWDEHGRARLDLPGGLAPAVRRRADHRGRRGGGGEGRHVAAARGAAPRRAERAHRQVEAELRAQAELGAAEAQGGDFRRSPPRQRRLPTLAGQSGEGGGLWGLRRLFPAGRSVRKFCRRLFGRDPAGTNPPNPPPTLREPGQEG
jgi:hypothetical protein